MEDECYDDYVELIHSNVRRLSQKVHLKTDFHGIEWFVCLEFGAPAFAEQRFVLRAANDPYALTITVKAPSCLLVVFMRLFSIYS